MSALREFGLGVALLGRGLRLWGSSPRLMLLGAVPALIVGAVFVGLLVLVNGVADDLAVAATPFADRWPDAGRLVVRTGVAAAIALLSVLLAVVTFTAVTLLVGDPFYERIWRRVEQQEGDAPPDDDRGFWRGLLRSAGDSLRLLVAAAAVGACLFVGGFVPVVGQTVVPVLGALTGGWFLAVELTGWAFDARGRTLHQRRRALSVNRARTLGLGTATWLSFLVPLGAVVVMPAAVAAATLLARDAARAEDGTGGGVPAGVRAGVPGAGLVPDGPADASSASTGTTAPGA